jgi:hypothetical protein
MPELPVILVGPNAATVVKPEDAGLRITLPANRQNRQPVGLHMKFPLSGDFEITASYELLAADKPPPGRIRYGVGVNLLISLGPEQARMAKIARYLVDQGTGYVADITVKEAPTPYQSQFVPSDNRAGKLRLRREGSTLRYLVAGREGQPFEEIYQSEFGPDEIGVIRLVANTAGTPAGVDVRLADLRIRHGTPLDPVQPEPAAEQPSGWNVWLAGGILGWAVTLCTGVALYLLHGRGAGKMSAAVAEGEQRPPAEAAAAVVSFLCSGCGKQLKGKASLVGKEVQCPGCGKPVRVPGSKTG